MGKLNNTPNRAGQDSNPGGPGSELTPWTGCHAAGTTTCRRKNTGKKGSGVENEGQTLKRVSFQAQRGRGRDSLSLLVCPRLRLLLSAWRQGGTRLFDSVTLQMSAQWCEVCL